MSVRHRSVSAVVRLLVCTGLAWTAVSGYATAGPVETGVVRGVVWTSDNSPVANAKVRLRNVETGRVVGATEASTNGEFVFAEVTKAAYLVELVSDSGKVLAVGATFRIERGQTISTIVRVPPRRSWYADMFSNSAAAVVAAAAHVGLRGSGSHPQPVSPQ